MSESVCAGGRAGGRARVPLHSSPVSPVSSDRRPMYSTGYTSLVCSSLKKIEKNHKLLLR